MTNFYNFLSFLWIKLFHFFIKKDHQKNNHHHQHQQPHQHQHHNEEPQLNDKSHDMSSLGGLTLLWKHLSQDDLDTLEKSNLLQSEKHFAKVFNLTEYHVDLLQACFLDYYFTQYWWARERKFSKEQISVYFSMVFILMDNIKGKWIYIKILWLSLILVRID